MYFPQTQEQFITWMQDPKVTAILAILSIWALIWKGIALWKASQKGEKIWFVILLMVNTFGILEIVYIYWLSKYSLKKFLK
jgi:membrane-bound ClpP family serine protease